MNADLTHASFFSGVGGTDLGLERAGWRTVSFSEIDSYACAVLAERWPGIPNLGNIVTLSGAADADLRQDGGRERQPRTNAGVQRATAKRDAAGLEWQSARLWSGGFPCQDLSVAGKRAGFAGERSVLAFAFLALVERHRPPAILLENVPGLLSSNAGRDFGALLGRMVELGYGVAYRVLDAQHFGVPQRRRRVFILGLRSDPDDADGRIAAERAAEVLSVGTRCGRHPATGHQAGPGVADGTTASSLSASAGHHGHSSPRGDGSDNVVIGTVPAALGHHGYTLGQEALRDGFLQLSTPPDADGMRAPDGLAGRAHDSERVVTQALPTQRVGTDDNDAQGGIAEASGVSDDPLLPLGLDSHRYRCCGNGVVAPVAEWLGLRLAEVFA